MANEKLSEHDKDLLSQIHEIDNKWGYARWLDIYMLSEQLESVTEKEYWSNVCSRYNHIEEYHARCI
jgi:hypothetical protein